MKFWNACAQSLAILTLGLAALAGAQQTPPAQPAPAGEQKPKILEGLPQGTYAWFKTNMGEFAVKLYPELIPNGTANFIGLANGTKMFIDLKENKEAKRPFYDGLTFHRIIDGFMIQGGDPLGDGTGGPGYRFKDEFDPKLRFDKPGKLAYANSGPNTNGSQFFITVGPFEQGNDHYVIIGDVVKGMDVVNAIAKTPVDKSDPNSPRPLKPVVMEKVRCFTVEGGAAAGAPQAADGKTTGTQGK